jgi:PAS domain S-box-containing protein
LSVLQSGDLLPIGERQMNNHEKPQQQFTERRKPDAALRESERRLSTLMSNLPGMAYRCRNDPKWTMDFISDGCVLLTGYTPIAFTGNHEIAYGDIIHQDDRGPVWQEVQRAVAEGRHFQLEYRITTASGEERWVCEQGIAVYSDSGEVEAIEGLVTDVTERKRAEKALRLSETKYRRLHQSITDAFASVDMNGFILECNEAFRKMLGYEPEELQTLRYTDVTPEKWHAFEANLIHNQVLSLGYSDVYEKEYRRKDGTVFPVELRAFLIRDDHGQPCAIWAIVRDITDRRRAQERLKKSYDELGRRVEQRTAELTAANEALRLSEEKYRMLIEACPDAVVMVDPQMRIVFASQQAVRLYGGDGQEELCGKSSTDFVVQDDRPRVLANVPGLLENGLQRNGEYTFVRKDGSRFPGEISTAVVKDASGQIIGMISVIRDVSELKRAIERLHNERRTLEHLLRASDHERQLIAYEIHDGLAQQLAGAIMQFQTFDRLKDKNPKELAKAYEAGMTMLRQGHFEARRLIAGVRPPILDESGVVEAIAHLVHEQVRSTGQKIDFHSSVDFDRLAPTLENSLYRIAQEGLANACRHSKSAKVRLTLMERNDRVKIEIRDWGIGFDTTAVQGNRFGLEGIRQRARLLGGKCRIRSSAGKGTMIAVELPVVLK